MFTAKLTKIYVFKVVCTIRQKNRSETETQYCHKSNKGTWITLTLKVVSEDKVYRPHEMTWGNSLPAEKGSLGWKYWRIIIIIIILNWLYVRLQSWTICYLLADCREKEILIQRIWLDKNCCSTGWCHQYFSPFSQTSLDFSSTLVQWFPNLMSLKPLSLRI